MSEVDLTSVPPRSSVDASISGGSVTIAGPDPLPVSVDNLPKTAFDEVSVAIPTPEVQLQFPYNINSEQVAQVPGNGGTVYNGNGHANISTGTDAAGYGLILSNDVLRYNAGQGGLARWTTVYTTGVANSEQLCGLGNRDDGFFFGYNGADFGVLLRGHGALEVRTLTISTASSTAENITITLDGVADAMVTVTNSGDPCETAREIATHSFFSSGNGWGAVPVGDKVEFYSIQPGAKTGSFTLSGATTTIGTFAQTIAGVLPTDTWTTQANWNIDTMDGTGPSGQTLDQTKGNVYQVRYQWLGYGAIVYSIEDAETGGWQPVHKIKYANANTNTTVHNPTLGLWMSATNSGNTSDLVMKTSSMAGFMEGMDAEIGPIHSADRLWVIGNTTAETPVLTIRNKGVYQGEMNRVRIKPLLATLTSNLNSATANATFRFYTLATPESGCSYTDVDTNSSVIEYDDAATAFDTTEATKHLTLILASNESRPFGVEKYLRNLNPRSTLMITVENSKGHASNESGAALNWKELF